jgi:phosphoesterase RecJ-like protein
VDITATSVSEILVELMQKYEEQLIDEDIATCLLSGIIEKTSSFQHVQTTPRAFLKASELVALGGRQQEVVKNIFKTKSLPLLKLWGRALARLKLIENLPVVYAPLSLMDFEKADAGSAEILPALKELVDNLGGNKIFALIFETQKNQIGLRMAVHEQVQTNKLLAAFPGVAQSVIAIGDLRLMEYSFAEQSLEEAERFFEQAIKTAMV